MFLGSTVCNSTEVGYSYRCIKLFTVNIDVIILQVIISRCCQGQWVIDNRSHVAIGITGVAIWGIDNGDDGITVSFITNSFIRSLMEYSMIKYNNLLTQYVTPLWWGGLCMSICITWHATVSYDLPLYHVIHSVVQWSWLMIRYYWDAVLTSVALQ